MGIERFFNTLKDKFNIINEIKPNSDIKIKCNCMFFDFNSHVFRVVFSRKLIWRFDFRWKNHEG